MPLLNVNKFKGLLQNVDYPELPDGYCHVLQNIDIDEELGKLNVRDGYQKKYDETLGNYPFTNIISAYEYYFEKADETVLIVNDNDALKIMIDSANPVTLTLPTVPNAATLENNFENQYLGYKDHILITTGTAATDYILWFGYVDRQAANNEGLFGNAEEYVFGTSSYLLTKAQLICPHGMFSNVRKVIYLDSFYYFIFENSKWVEKRDLNFKLVDRFVGNTEQAASGEEADTGNDMSICEDGTYIYIAYLQATSGDFAVEKINPVGWNQEAIYTGTIPGTIAGICTDGTNLYLANTSATDGEIHEILCATMVATGVTAVTANEDNIIDICCDDTINTGVIYTLKAGQLERRTKVTLVYNVGDIFAGNAAQVHCVYDIANNNVYVSSTTGDGHIYDYHGDDFTAGETNDYITVDEPKAFIEVGGTAWRAISGKYGTVESIETTPTYFPGLVGINLVSTAAGTLDAGTYFYKLSVVDVDGEEYTLSDPIMVIHTVDTRLANLCITAHTDYLNDFYRVKYINIYRAYSSTQDSEDPDTDYKFLKQIDINSTRWVDDSAAHEIYYYDYTDNTAESVISTVTYFENSGIADTVKPRYINGKYLTWLENQLHLAHFSHDGDTYPNRIIRTPVDQPDNVAFYDYYDFLVGDGDTILDIGEMGGRTVVFKNRKLGVFYNGIPEDVFIPGISGSQAWCKKDDVIYFISDQGMHYFDGRQCINIKDNVKVLFDAAATYTNAKVFHIDSRDRIIFSIRANRSFILNVKTKTWMYYDSSFAFRGYFKNYANEYICWDQTGFYICFAGHANDGQTLGGAAGTGIAIDYESPLIRFSGDEGTAAILVSHRHRLYKGTDTITFTLYDYQADASGKTSVATQALAAPGGAAQAVKTYFFDSIRGESFSVRINGTVDGGDFEYHGLTLEYLPDHSMSYA